MLISIFHTRAAHVLHAYPQSVDHAQFATEYRCREAGQGQTPIGVFHLCSPPLPGKPVLAWKPPCQGQTGQYKTLAVAPRPKLRALVGAPATLRPDAHKWAV